MRKLIKIFLLAVFILIYCTACTDESTYNNSYETGYENGYEAGYEEAEKLFDVIYDEVEYKKSNMNEAVFLMFEAAFDGKQLKDGEVWKAGNFLLKYNFEQEKYLHFYIKFTDFDIKTICNDSVDNFVDNLPVTCYIGFYNKYGEWTATEELFVGEKIFLDEFNFTSDGYLTDYNDYSDIFINNNTLHILLFVNQEVYAAIYNIS